MKLNKLAGVSSLLLLCSGYAQATTEIEWWHAMGGNLGEKVNEIADKFNASQTEFVVKPEFNCEVRHSSISSSQYHFFKDNRWLLEA
ncbi:hypothetical protein [Enterovibrio norvegicus]|uniref:hypothetical protein n=1 Tax=Enterovibrio norvegicus TaxID=188144 RepID=UPI0024B0EB7C|nr:hypothetical protein [Enterovibrio norvegicus]